MTSEQTKTRGPQIQVRTGLQGETDGNKTNSLRHPCANHAPRTLSEFWNPSAGQNLISVKDVHSCKNKKTMWWEENEWTRMSSNQDETKTKNVHRAAVSKA